MVVETTLETVSLSSLVNNDITSGWFDYSKSNEGRFAVGPDGTLKLYKHPYITEKGAIAKYPNQHVILNGRNPIEKIKALANETEIVCHVVKGVTESNILEIVNTLNSERILKDWEKCEKARAFLPPATKPEDKRKGGGERWRIAIDKANVDISEDTLERYCRALDFDQETNRLYNLENRIKGIELLPDQETMTISEANKTVSRHRNKEKLRAKYPDKEIHVDPIYTDLIQDFHIWQQDNRQPWLIDDESIQLVFCSPHYFNQRKYTEEEVEYEPQKLADYLNDLQLAFTQAYLKLKKDGVLVVNIGDTHKIGENYMVQQRFVLMLAEKLGFNFIFKQIWCKSNGLAKGYDKRAPTYDYEEIFYFAKSEKYYFKPIEINELKRDIVVAYYNGRQNPDGSKTKGKWMVSKEYETFKQFVEQSKFEDILITGTASAESRAITEKYKDKDGKPIKHPAVMPLVIPLYPILCFTKPGDIVFDPWTGTGTTLKVALATGRKARGIDLEERFVNIANDECQFIVDLFK